MKRTALFVLLAAMLYAGYSLTYPTYSYRYRITIEVDTSEGLKSGSSVLEVKTIQYPSWVTLGANNHQMTVRGEAVFVDLGQGRNLVALLALGPHAVDDRATLFAPRAFFSIVEDSPRNLEWTKRLSTMTGRRPFAANKRPTLVTFADPKDPATVREVPFDNPESVLGSHVRSVRSWIELTTHPVTSGLEAQLPWIGESKARRTVWRTVRRGQPGSSAGPLGIFIRRGGEW